MEEALGAKTKQTHRLRKSAHNQAVEKATAGTGCTYQLTDERTAKVDREVREWKRGGRGEVPRDTLGLVDAARRLHKRMAVPLVCAMERVLTVDMQVEALLHERAEAGVSFRTSTRALDGACSYTHVDSVRRLNVGRVLVLVLNDPPVDLTSRSPA